MDSIMVITDVLSDKLEVMQFKVLESVAVLIICFSKVKT